jgi:hypothetical protein
MEIVDYVVVGGGSAGCVVASRLTEDATTRVCGDEQDRSDHDQCGGSECTTSIGNRTAEGVGSSSRPGVAQRGGGSQCSSCLVLRGIQARLSPRHCSGRRRRSASCCTTPPRGKRGAKRVRMSLSPMSTRGPRSSVPSAARRASTSSFRRTSVRAMCAWTTTASQTPSLRQSRPQASRMSSCSRPSALSNRTEPDRCSASATQRLYSVEPKPP